MSFKDYKKNHAKFVDEDSLKELESFTENKSYDADPDDWYPGVDKAGNGRAVIRFLPPIEGEKLPIVQWFSHNFQNPKTGLWYIENSLTSLGKAVKDPCGDFNRVLWNSTKDENHPNRKQASEQKRKLNFRANIFIVSDSANPENNGKVKKFKFGKVIYDMIRLAMNPPEIEGSDVQEEKINPFDLFAGANLELKIFSEKKGDRLQRNYSRSTWKEAGPLGDDALLEKVYNELNGDAKWSLKQFIADDKFKSYEDLKTRLDLVLGHDSKTGEPLESNTKAKDADKAPAAKEASPKTQKAAGKAADKNADYFKNLIENDGEEEDGIPF